VNDRELLELAAKAVGLELRAAIVLSDGTLRGIDVIEGGKIIHYWHPLADDGDAFRLAVTLGLDLRLSQYLPTAHDVTPGISLPDGDAFESVRRAIVVAAAEIGRKMPVDFPHG
jgi:hypothetical protein